MKKSLILSLVLIISFVGLVSGAENITLTYPKNVIFGEEFEVTLTLIDFGEDIYDIKIEIINEIGSNIAKRFWDDGWESSDYWMYNATNTSETSTNTFRLNITEEYEGIANITVEIMEDWEEGIVYEIYQLNVEIPEQESEPLISIEVNWDEENIINGKEFEIEVKVFNLEDEEYDVKVWIEFEDNDSVISDRYGEDSEGEEVWKSGRYYIYNLFNGPGNKTKDVELRIREKHRDFKGDANLFVKIKGEIEEEENIEVLEAEEDDEKEEEEEEIKETIKTPLITGGVIRLGSSGGESETENIKTNKNIIYESKTEKIKKYAVFGFAFLCVGLSVLLIFNKIN